MVCQEMQKLNVQIQGAWRQLPSHLADVEEEPKPSKELPSLVADTRTPADKNVHKAPGNYPYPFATNRSKNPPPRPCRNCGSTVHYDRDCDSWRKQGRMNSKKLPANAANTAYEEAYIAMLQGDEEACSSQCDTYYAMVDTLTPVESLLVSMTVDSGKCANDFLNPSITLNESSKDESSWTSLETRWIRKPCLATSLKMCTSRLRYGRDLPAMRSEA